MFFFYKSVNSVQRNLRIQSSLRHFIVFCEEIWMLCNCLLVMFVFRSFEPWYQKDKHQLSCVDNTVSCLFNLVDAVCLTSITSQYPFFYVKALHIEMICTIKYIFCTLSKDWHEEATEKLPVLEVTLMLTS
jgi:hypothetical protein